MKAKFSLQIQGMVAVAILVAFEVSAEEITNWTGCPIDLDVYFPDRVAVELTTGPPSRKLSHGAEVILVSAHDSKIDPSAETKVLIDRPGKDIFLILYSAQNIIWHVQATPSTVVRAIVASSRNVIPIVRTDTVDKIHVMYIRHPYPLGGSRFVTALSELNRRLDISKIDVYRSQRSYLSLIISEVDPPNPLLALTGPEVLPPTIDLPFVLYADDKTLRKWTLAGPQDGRTHGVSNRGRFVVSPSSENVYLIKDRNIVRIDMATAAEQEIPHPEQFSAEFWPRAIAYDSKRNIVLVYSHFPGHAGLYRFDATTGEWISYEGTAKRWIVALAYDPTLDRYAAWTRLGELLFLSSSGKLISPSRANEKRAQVREAIFGFEQLADGSPPNVLIVPRGSEIGLVVYSRDIVKGIWQYDAASGASRHTYRAPPPEGFVYSAADFLEAEPFPTLTLEMADLYWDAYAKLGPKLRSKLEDDQMNWGRNTKSLCARSAPYGRRSGEESAAIRDNYSGRMLELERITNSGLE